MKGEGEGTRIAKRYEETWGQWVYFSPWWWQLFHRCTHASNTCIKTHALNTCIKHIKLYTLYGLFYVNYTSISLFLKWVFKSFSVMVKSGEIPLVLWFMVKMLFSTVSFSVKYKFISGHLKASVSNPFRLPAYYLIVT